MDQTTTLIIIGGGIAVAFLAGFLCDPLGLCPSALAAKNKAQNQQLFGGSLFPSSIPAAGGTKAKPDYTAQQKALFPQSGNDSFPDRITTAVGYSYAGYSSAPLTVA